MILLKESHFRGRYFFAFLISFLALASFVIAETKDGCDLLDLDSRCELVKNELSILINSENIKIVDLRTNAEFEKLHIIGSENRASSEIRSKTHLQDVPILLVGNTLSEATLEKVCRNLYQSKFRSVKVLRGGIFEWVKAGGQVVGDKSNLIPPLLVSAEDLISSKLVNPIYVGLNIEQGKILPDEEWQNILTLDSIPKSTRSMVLVTKDGDKGLLNKLRERKLNDNTYFIEGGIASLKSALITFQKAIERNYSDGASCR